MTLILGTSLLATNCAVINVEQGELTLRVDEEKEILRACMQEDPPDKPKPSKGEKVKDLDKREKAKLEGPPDKKSNIEVHRPSWKRNLEKNHKDMVKLKDSLDQQTRGFTDEFNKEGVVKALKMPAPLDNTCCYRKSN